MRSERFKAFSAGGILARTVPCLLLTWSVAACGARTVGQRSPDSHQVASVADNPDQASIPASGPPSFREFAEGFLGRVNRTDSSIAIDDLVAPSLGLLFASSPGASIEVGHYASFRKLAESGAGSGYARSDEYRLGCETEIDALVRRDGRLPQMDCESERWDTGTQCAFGEIRLSELSDALAAARRFGDEPKAEVTERVRRIEPMVSHYVFDPKRHRGYLFGIVDGRWRLLYFRAITACSA